MYTGNHWFVNFKSVCTQCTA